MPKLIVMIAFDRSDEDSELRPAFEPRAYQSEGQAVFQAQLAAGQYAGVIAWSREASPDVGEYGDPLELFRSGEVPDME